MRITVTCRCGAKLRAESKDIGRRGICPYCAQPIEVAFPKDEIVDLELAPEPEIVEAQLVREYLDPPRSPDMFPHKFHDGPSSPQQFERQSTDEATPQSSGSLEPRVPWLEMFLNNLLSPRSIRWLCVLGGGLMVLGSIVWLASLGVFNDPRLIASVFSVGSLAVHLTGVLVSLRTKQKMVGQALTFLGCVLLPLNLWYYHAQGLITLDGWLWVGGLVCSVLYLFTLVLLRDPLFIYAFEAGVTLTSILILGNLGLIDQTPAYAFLFITLAAVSIHTELIFSLRGKASRTFGLPFFWCGQAQLIAAIAVLSIVQLIGWMHVPLQEITGQTWEGNLITNWPLLTAGLWLAGAYLYFYSDFAVRKIGVYALAGAFCLLMTEATLAGIGEWKMEWRMALLSTTALVVSATFFFLGKQNEIASRLLSPCVLLLSVPSVLFGLLLHIRTTSQVWKEFGWGYETGWEFLVVMFWSAICARVCAALLVNSHRFSSSVFLFLSAAGILGACAGLLRIIGLTEWVHQAPLLMLVPIGYIIAARFERGLLAERPLGWISHAGAGLILIASLMASVADLGIRLGELEILAGSISNLFLALVFAEGAVFYVLAAYFRLRSANWGLAAAAMAATVWQILVYVHMPWELCGPVIALLGLAISIIGAVRGVRAQTRYTASGENLVVYVGPGRLLHEIGNGMMVFAWLVDWLGCVIAYVDYADDLSWRPVGSLLFCVVLAISAVVSARSRVWRYVHASAATLLLCTAIFQLYLLLELNPWQVLEYTVLVLGVVLLIAAYVGRLFEKQDEPNELITLGLGFGSVLAAAPLFISLIVHRYFGDGVFLPDELGFLTVAAVMVALAVVLQTRTPACVGVAALVLYTLILLISIAYLPQITIGVYLTLGGGLLFVSALLLSIYREKIVRIPELFAKREGMFKVLAWR